MKTVIATGALFAILAATLSSTIARELAVGQDRYRHLGRTPCKGERVCKAIEKFMQIESSNPARLCSLEKSPAAAKVGFSLPKWKKAEGGFDLSLVETAMAQSFYINDPAMQELSKEIGTKDWAILNREMWRRKRDAYFSFFRTDRAAIEFANFDIDGDGKPERLYRFPLFRLPGLNSTIELRYCDDHQRYPLHEIHLAPFQNDHLSKSERINRESTLKTMGAGKFFNFETRLYWYEGVTQDATLMAAISPQGETTGYRSIWGVIRITTPN